jgi:hypothetical protein
MHQEQGLQFRAYVPVLMELLEDADGMVRDVARVTVIELFRYARLLDTASPYPAEEANILSMQERTECCKVRSQEAAQELQSPPGNRVSYRQGARTHRSHCCHESRTRNQTRFRAFDPTNLCGERLVHVERKTHHPDAC